MTGEAIMCSTNGPPPPLFGIHATGNFSCTCSVGEFYINIFKLAFLKIFLHLNPSQLSLTKCSVTHIPCKPIWFMFLISIES